MVAFPAQNKRRKESGYMRASMGAFVPRRDGLALSPLTDSSYSLPSDRSCQVLRKCPSFPPSLP